MSTDSQEQQPDASSEEEAPKAKKATRKTTKKIAKKAAKKAPRKKVSTTETDAKQMSLFTPDASPDESAKDTSSNDDIVPKKKPTKKAAKEAPQADLSAEQNEASESPRGTQEKKSAKKGARKRASGKDAESSNKTSEIKVEEESPSDHKGKKDFKGRDHKNRKKRPEKKKKEIVLTGDPVEVNGLIEIAPKGYGFLRCPEKGYSQARDDVFVPPEQVKQNGLRHCMWIHGLARTGPKGLQMTEVTKINGIAPADFEIPPFFNDLKAVNPDKRISFESSDECFNTRVLDLVSPVGRGQRGLIVAPPRSGKTTLLMDIAKSLMDRHEDTIHPIFLLVDERPEEVTEFKRALPDIEMFSSSNDSGNRNHMRVAELCIERAKRLVEQGQHVFILMDSITRLARAYNRGSDSGGGGKGGKGNHNKNRGYQSGGIVAGALEIPRRLFAAARNTREAGSLTILATALINTNSKADEAIFQEFKGTGNMEIVLDRRLADHYIYPAVDIFKSGTRREELLLPEITLKKFHLIRRGLKGHRTDQAMERLLYFLKKFPNNAQMLMEIKG